MLNIKNPCEIIKGKTKLFGMSVRETKLEMSTLNMLQNPIKYNPPQINKYVRRIVVAGTFFNMSVSKLSYVFIVLTNANP